MIGRGSEWRRWEPHIHAPGTVLNNQFGGGDPWEGETAEELRTLTATGIRLVQGYVLARPALEALPDIRSCQLVAA